MTYSDMDSKSRSAVPMFEVVLVTAWLGGRGRLTLLAFRPLLGIMKGVERSEPSPGLDNDDELAEGEGWTLCAVDPKGSSSLKFVLNQLLSETAVDCENAKLGLRKAVAETDEADEEGCV
jgi:hypothetical protein